jgi:hypothetical protein
MVRVNPTLQSIGAKSNGGRWVLNSLAEPSVSASCKGEVNQSEER